MAKRRRRRGRGRGGRRRNPDGISYGNAALIGAGLGAVGVAIATAIRVTQVQHVMSTPVGFDVGQLLGYVEPSESPGMAIAKGALRGAVLGMAVGVSTAVVANEMGVSAMGRMMNPASAAPAIALGTAMATTTLMADHLVHKAVA